MPCNGSSGHRVLPMRGRYNSQGSKQAADVRSCSCKQASRQSHDPSIVLGGSKQPHTAPAACSCESKGPLGPDICSMHPLCSRHCTPLRTDTLKQASRQTSTRNHLSAPLGHHRQAISAKAVTLKEKGRKGLHRSAADLQEPREGWVWSGGSGGRERDLFQRGHGSQRPRGG